MSRSIATGPLLLLLWQTAPVSVGPDSTGRVRVSLGYGAGVYHSTVEQVSCQTGDRTQISTKDGGWTTGTAEVDAWPTHTVRANVVATQLSPGAGASDRWTTTGLVAGEWRQVGVGGGLVHGSGADPFTAPLVYLRLSDLDRKHFRVEVAVPEPPVPGRTWLRIGTGYNLGRRAGSRWITGVATTWPGGGDPHMAFFGDAFVPLGQGASPAELKLSAQFGFGKIYHESISMNGAYTSWRLGAGVRYSFGR
jgi:hypothetical protein